MQQQGMFRNGRGDWRERDVQRSEERKYRRDKIRVGDDVETVYRGCARVAGISRVSSTVCSRAVSITPEKCYYRRSRAELTKGTGWSDPGGSLRLLSSLLCFPDYFL